MQQRITQFMRQAQARQKFGSQLVSRRRQRGFASQSHISGSLDTKILKKLPNHPEKLKKSLVQNPITCLYLTIISVKWFCRCIRKSAKHFHT